MLMPQAASLQYDDEEAQISIFRIFLILIDFQI
jgi:hypothetical protein